MAEEKPILYSYWRSSCSWRVRLALEWKGIEYTYKAVNLIKDGGEQKSEEYTKLNPQKIIPSLVIGEKVLTQSLAIMEYLEEVHPHKPLLPNEPFLKAEVRKICLAIAADIQPLQNLKVLNAIGEDKKMAWANNVIDQGFQSLEKILEKTSGKFCVGDQVTLADFCLVPQVYNAQRFNVDMKKFPVIARIEAELSKIPEFLKAHPSNQPDAVN